MPPYNSTRSTFGFSKLLLVSNFRFHANCLWAIFRVPLLNQTNAKRSNSFSLKKNLPNKLRQNDACLSLFAAKKKTLYMPTLNQESECSTSSVTSFNTSAVDFYEAKVTELNLVHCV